MSPFAWELAMSRWAGYLIAQTGVIKSTHGAQLRILEDKNSWSKNLVAGCHLHKKWWDRSVCHNTTIHSLTYVNGASCISLRIKTKSVSWRRKQPALLATRPRCPPPDDTASSSSRSGWSIREFEGAPCCCGGGCILSTESSVWRG